MASGCWDPPPTCLLHQPPPTPLCQWGHRREPGGRRDMGPFCPPVVPAAPAAASPTPAPSAPGTDRPHRASGRHQHLPCGVTLPGGQRAGPSSGSPGVAGGVLAAVLSSMGLLFALSVPPPPASVPCETPSLTTQGASGTCPPPAPMGTLSPTHCPSSAPPATGQRSWALRGEAKGCSPTGRAACPRGISAVGVTELWA